MLTRIDKFLLSWFLFLGYLGYITRDYKTVSICLWIILGYSIFNAVVAALNLILGAILNHIREENECLKKKQGL